MTRVEVMKGQFAFAGSYVIGQSLCCKNADLVQVHYANVLSWRRTREWPDPERLYNIDCLYTGEVREANRDDTAKASFLRSAKDDLPKDWISLLR